MNNCARNDNNILLWITKILNPSRSLKLSMLKRKAGCRIFELAHQYANGTIKLTTRQAFQLQGVFMKNLKKTIREINDTLLDTIAACGDVNRNVMCNPLSNVSAVHEQVYADTLRVSKHLTPHTRAYHEIWLDEKLVSEPGEEKEPVYGRTYLPRKFKIAFAIPPDNDTDIYANDLAFIAIVKEKQLRWENQSGITIYILAEMRKEAGSISCIKKRLMKIR